MRDAHVTLGEGDGTPLERALHFFRAGEICEHHLADDESADETAEETARDADSALMDCMLRLLSNPAGD